MVPLGYTREHQDQKAGYNCETGSKVKTISGAGARRIRASSEK